MAIVPASARADTTAGCGPMFDWGNNLNNPVGNGQDVGGYLYFRGSYGADTFCNVSIPVNGVFEITDQTTNGCVGVNSTTGVLIVESSTACAVNSGKVYPWDEWTATPYNYGGYVVWELRNADTGECMYDDLQEPAVENTCIATDTFEYIYWDDSGL